MAEQVEAPVVQSEAELARELSLLSDAQISSGCPRPDEQRFATALRRVLRLQGPLVFNYQPIVDLRRGLVVGYEGLVRFGGDLNWSPDRWFAGAERYGLRLDLEDLVTRQLLQARGHLPRNCFLSINVSPSFVLSPRWDAILGDAGSLGGLVVEITENESVEDYKPLCAKLEAIRERGGSIAIDDAGSGYASLHHVMATKPDFVKLDRVFITDCDSDRAKSALIEMVGKAAGRLDAWIIAEGVETATELDELIRLNVPLAQGFFLSRPQPEMRELAEERTQTIVSRAHVLTPAHTVENATEACAVCTSEDGAMQLLADEPKAYAAVVTDCHGRPVALVERHPNLGVRVVRGLVRAQGSTPGSEVLERAMTRSADVRFDPMVAINEQGEFIGVIRVERLVTQLLSRV